MAIIKIGCILSIGALFGVILIYGTGFIHILYHNVITRAKEAPTQIGLRILDCVLLLLTLVVVAGASSFLLLIVFATMQGMVQ